MNYFSDEMQFNANLCAVNVGELLINNENSCAFI